MHKINPEKATFQAKKPLISAKTAFFMPVNEALIYRDNELLAIINHIVVIMRY